MAFSESISHIESQPSGLSILDLNIQNVYSKFDELICFVQNVNTQHPISAICLNECWISRENDTTGLHIEGYNMFFQRGNRVGHGYCGLIIYIHEAFLSQEVIIENVNTSWDLVADNDLFTTEFSSFLRSVKHSHSSVFICGDFNINLLSINSNSHFADYFDSVISSGLNPCLESVLAE